METKSTQKAKKKKKRKSSLCYSGCSKSSPKNMKDNATSNYCNLSSSWISKKETRKILGETSVLMSDEEISDLLTQLYLIAGTVLDIAIFDIDQEFEERMDS